MVSPHCSSVSAIAVVVILAGPAQAQTAPDLETHVEYVDGPEAVVVFGRGQPQIGEALSGSQGVVGYRDFWNRPLTRVGELVENVPGVIATQHSGTGKANQYFLRGFNLDHGTDFAGFVDGVPVNMRTQGHGQGYLDLNFIIPELVERIDYRKGPYFADVGDFSAAGTIAFSTVQTLPETILEASAGENGYYRGLVAGSSRIGEGDLLVALDGTLYDVPWDLDEDLSKINALAKYSTGDATKGWNVALGAYHAEWNATDQIPLRAVESGLIDRFGYIDPDLGGRTTRVGLTANGASGNTDWTAYAIYYDFRLTSNFTYFLDDPIDGDEFQQRDRRGVFGGRVRHRMNTIFLNMPAVVTIGGDARYDTIDNVGLYGSVDGNISDTVRQDEVDQYSGAVFGEIETPLNEQVRLMLGLRGDLYGYRVRSDDPANSGDGSDGMLSPKAAIAWRPSNSFEFYANYGETFHSNDVRGATITIDPATGDPADQVDVLVRARGAELGGRVEAGDFTASLVGYYLILASELVFVGDAGATEPNAASRRYGAEATLFWRPYDWLTLDASGAVTHARFRGVPPGEDRIPNSVSEVFAAGASVDFDNGLSGSLRLRHFGTAPLVEDNSARSEGTTLVNLGGYYR